MAADALRLAAPGGSREALLQLAWRPFQFPLPRALVTAQGALAWRRGWLLRLEDGTGAVGWGEAAPLEWAETRGAGVDRRGANALAQEPGAVNAPAHAACAAAIEGLGALVSRQELEARLPTLPPELSFALGLALAELDGLGSPASGGWRAAPPAAELLPAGEAVLPVLEDVLAARQAPAALPPSPLTVKWKVAATDDGLERRLLEQLLAGLPAGARLRLDANGGWDRATAGAWADRLAGDPRLEWLEQPLAPADQAGLEALAARLPVALDESLRQWPALMASWPGWQVRRPVLEGDPRPLLAELAAGRPRLMLSTAFETGVGRRLLGHLAALQAEGPTPTAPGLAPGWRPEGLLFSADPQRAWEALA
ncbi:o-succinylbenzoate synthase [Vulcanococcus limneticus]|uniref:o-succinylbenzoate synthase n=1 Tax=Vulcanococcus limneticus TaxID=2170428 RepID=UPI00398C0BE1